MQQYSLRSKDHDDYLTEDDSSDEENFNSSIQEVNTVTSNELKFETIEDQIVYRTNSSQTIIITKSDLECLIGQNYLNDKIIEFYLLFIKDNLSTERASKVHIFSSFFFSKMLETRRCYKSDNHFYENLYLQVHRWTNNIDIFSYDFLIVPIFKDHHWSVAILCYINKLLLDEIELDTVERPCILFLDSINKSKSEKVKTSFQYGRYLTNFIQQEILNKKNPKKFLVAEDIQILNPITPHQKNDYDCGIFMLHYVEIFLRNPDIIFSNSRLARVSLKDWFKSESLHDKRSKLGKLLLQIYRKNRKDVGAVNSEDVSHENDDIAVIEDTTKMVSDNTEMLKDDLVNSGVTIGDKSINVNSIYKSQENDDAIVSESSNNKQMNDKFDPIFAKNPELMPNVELSINDFDNLNYDLSFNCKSPNYEIKFEDEFPCNIFEPEIDIRLGDEMNSIQFPARKKTASQSSSSSFSSKCLTSQKEQTKLSTSDQALKSFQLIDLIDVSPEINKTANKSNLIEIKTRTRNLAFERVCSASSLTNQSIESPNKKIKINVEHNLEALIDLSFDEE